MVRSSSSYPEPGEAGNKNLEVVGATGFEPATSWSQIKSEGIAKVVYSVPSLEIGAFFDQASFLE
jgi:hypothetical protein